jgi:PASTA domain
MKASRRRWFRVAALATASVGLGAVYSPLSAQQTPGCTFILGFQTLHDLDPADIGDCTDNQVFPPNGDAQQRTTKGLMAWRKADNGTAFTNTYMSWINGPSGLVNRLNTDRFSWEGADAPQPTATPTAASAPTAQASPTGFVVPNVVGMDWSKALGVVNAAGLATPQWAMCYRVDQTKTYESVLDQQPAAGTNVAKGSFVYLQVNEQIGMVTSATDKQPCRVGGTPTPTH